MNGLNKLCPATVGWRGWSRLFGIYFISLIFLKEIIRFDHLELTLDMETPIFRKKISMRPCYGKRTVIAYASNKDSGTHLTAQNLCCSLT